MSWWSNTVEKVWDGFLKATGAGLVALVGAACVWAYTALVPVQHTASLETYDEFFTPRRTTTRGGGYADGTYGGRPDGTYGVSPSGSYGVAPTKPAKRDLQKRSSTREEFYMSSYVPPGDNIVDYYDVSVPKKK